MKVADTFAKFVAHTEFHDMDPSVIEYVKMLTLKQVIGMLVGSAALTSKKVIRYIMENPGRPEGGVYGCGFRADVVLGPMWLRLLWPTGFLDMRRRWRIISFREAGLAM